MKKALTVIIICLLLCGCEDYAELNNLSIVTAAGIDKAGDKYEVTLLIANSPKNETTNKEGEAKTTVYQGKAKTIAEAVKIIDTDDPLHFLVDYTKTNGLERYPTQPYGPFAFFSEVQYNETYPGYYGWPTSYRPTSASHRAFVSIYSAGLYTRLYSGIIITGDQISDTKYLYTCFKKSTHQYGLYDAIHGVFYVGFEETRLGYWNDPNYYWNHIESASGNTRFDKEKTFIKICGPVD